MRPPEERRLRKHLGRPPVPEDPVVAAAQREALAVAEAAANKADEEEQAAAEAAAAEAEARAERRALRRTMRTEHKAKVVKFLSAMMGNNLRISFAKWRGGVTQGKAERAAAAEAARAEAARRRMGVRVGCRDELRRRIVSLCGERNGERTPTYTERPGILLGPGWGGVEEREVAVALCLDKLWPVMEEPGARLLADLLQETAAAATTSRESYLDSFGSAAAAAAAAAAAGVGGVNAGGGVVVEAISLANNALGRFGCAALSRALPICAKLGALDLRGNGLGDEGAIALAQVLGQCKSLAVLKLGDNHIGDKGACGKSIAKTPFWRCHFVFYQDDLMFTETGSGQTYVGKS
jgi:hypothetical protein